MNRSDTEREIVETLGQVPPFFASMPDEVLERQWSDFKEFQFGDTVLSAREKQLIGFAVAAAIHCPYCTYFHRTATTLMGTDEKQLEEAARVAAETALYSAYIHAQSTDIGDFQRMTDQIGDHIKRQSGEAREAA
jgi:AhpD family alkylhydroperoxidase